MLYRTVAVSRPRAALSSAAWLVAATVPASFVLYLAWLILYVAPEYDDYCYFVWYDLNGVIGTALSSYFGFQGRVFPFVVFQVPGAIAGYFGVGILPAYAITLAIMMAAFVAGCSFAIIRAFPRLPVALTIFLTTAFVSAILGATPDLHDLLYWNAALACYVPPGVISAIILGECVRALDRGQNVSRLAAGAMAFGGFMASICNEYTGVWLIVIVVTSFLARIHVGHEPQARHHTLILAFILAGVAVVLLAPGNSIRLEGAGGLRLREFGTLAPRALNYALNDLGRFMSSPTVIGWSLVSAVVALALPARPAKARRERLAAGVIAVCLGCCYVQYLTAHLATGVRLVERAQNQALILLMFGLTVSIVLWMQTPKLREYLQVPIALDAVTTPFVLGISFAGSLLGSTTALHIGAQHTLFHPFWQENVARDRMLTNSKEQAVIVHQHRWKPSLLFGSDIDLGTGCFGNYYHKTVEVAPEPEP